MHIDVGIGGPLMAATVWLLAVVLGWPAGQPWAAVAVLAGYLVFLVLIQLLAGARTDPDLGWRPPRRKR